MTNRANNDKIHLCKSEAAVSVWRTLEDMAKDMIMLCLKKGLKMKENMKKILTVLILTLSMTALVACSKDEPDQGVNPTETVTKEPEATPTEAVTPEPTATSEPTATPEPIPTETEALEVTGEAGSSDGKTDEEDITPTEEPVVTEIDNGKTDTDDIKTDGNPLQLVYMTYEDGADIEAAEVASAFINGFLTYDAETTINNIACDEAHKSELDEINTSFDEMKEAMAAMGDYDISSIISVNILGGRLLTDDEIQYAVPGALVDVENEVTDLQVFSASLSSSIPAFAESYKGSFMNIAVGKYKGEYKVIMTENVYVPELVDDPEITDVPEIIDDPAITDEPEATPTPMPIVPDNVDYSEMLYKFRGDETADEIAALYAESNQNLDILTMLSCVAMDEDALQEEMAELGTMIAQIEEMKTLLTEDSYKVTLGESSAVEDDVLEKLKEKTTQIDWADVSDVTRYVIRTDITMFDQTKTQETYIYVGKYKGEYRVLNADVYDDFE